MLVLVVVCRRVLDATIAHSLCVLGTLQPVRPKGNIVTLEEIQRVRCLIEKCLPHYLSQTEVIGCLKMQANIEPGFTGLGTRVGLGLVGCPLAVDALGRDSGHLPPLAGKRAVGSVRASSVVSSSSHASSLVLCSWVCDEWSSCSVVSLGRAKPAVFSGVPSTGAAQTADFAV